MKKVYFVVANDGTIYDGSAQYTEGRAILEFVKCLLPAICAEIDQEVAIAVWSKFKIIGYKVESVTPPTMDA